MKTTRTAPVIELTIERDEMLRVNGNEIEAKFWVFNKCRDAGMPVQRSIDGNFSVTTGTLKSTEIPPNYICIRWESDLPPSTRQRLWANIKGASKWLWNL